ncbi:serpin family protein [Demequina sp. SYSU T00068]|uniref:serpin family protein n=1 Tax=Demequina lignilytica TaxID=3051663 RepID=UPI0026275FDE|nr:serpin family protein [Demequina sp. SYSU T00068]MDN4491706.1 serpin family protein [Demequina sp. SYSU T00068]
MASSAHLSAADDRRALARSIGATGVAIFRAAAGDRNLAVSPLSVGLAFGMVGAGASGPVEAAIGRLFGRAFTDPTLLPAFRELAEAAASEPGAGAENADGDTVDLPIVRIANGLWLDRSYVAAPSYTDAVARWFGATVESAPLRTEPARSAERIDAWASHHTAGLIPLIVPPGVPGPDTVAVLANTVYLKARWWAPFDAGSTSDGDFHREDGTVVEAALMHGDLRMRYHRDEAFDAAVLPYVGDLEMVLVLPRPGSLAEVRRTFGQDTLDSLDRAWHEGHVAVTLPRLEAAETLDLRAAIEGAMGVAGLFGTVGLGRIGPDLELDTAVHSTMVIIDESGTEAAAATVLGISLTGMPLYDAEIRADRPFLYVIRQASTGLVLMIGQCMDPTAG